MQYARRLLESRSLLDRIPDQSLLLSNPGLGTRHTRATRAADSSYALIYSAAGEPFTVDLDKLSGQGLVGSWYDPRTGAADALGSVPAVGAHTFTPPTRGADNDWVLTLDAEGRA
jgi:hypothetical protein